MEKKTMVKTPRASVLVRIDSKVIDTVELKMHAKRAIEARQSTSRGIINSPDPTNISHINIF